MKKFFSAALLTILLAGCTNINQPTPSNPTPSPVTQPSSPSVQPTPPPPVQPPAPTPAPSAKVYQNSTYHFAFTYPDTFTFTTPDYANLSEKIVEVQLPSTAYPKTNFGDAGFAVSAASANSLQKCLSMDLPEGSKGFIDTTTINSITFYKTEGMGAAAGNRYATRSYRIFHGSKCFEITEVIHTSNIANYDPGTVTEVDQKEIWKGLESILSTFTIS